MDLDWDKIKAYLSGHLTPEVKADVEKWLAADSSHQRMFENVKEYYLNDSDKRIEFTPEEIDSRYEAIMRAKSVSRRRRWSYSRIGVAASAAIALCVGALTLWTRYERERGMSLADYSAPREISIMVGEGLELTPQELALSNSATIKNAENTKIEYNIEADEAITQTIMHTITVPRGRTYEVKLSDGTVVKLNPETKFSYPVSFSAEQLREVHLDGEAFFEVAKSELKFIVHAHESDIQVYGTSFNVISRKDGGDKAVLVSGSVGVKGRHSSDEVMLMPGQQATVYNDMVTVIPVDLAVYEAAQNGYMFFNGITFGEITEILSQFYDIEFTYEAEELKEIEMVSSVRRDATLEEVLKVLEFGSSIKFRYNGKEVVVRRK